MTPLHRAIENVARGGDAAAVVDAAGVATYATLRETAAGIAAALRGADVRPGDRVALLLPKGRVETAALLAVWSVEASAVPLDAASPDARNRRILDGAGVRLVVGDGALAARLERTVVDPAAARSAPSARELAARGVAPTAEAVVLHTSGSTGVPKGVPVTHAGVAAFVDWMSAEFDVRPGDAVAALASPTFDLALFEQIAPLAAGGTIVRPDDRIALSVRKLASFLDAARVACIYAVPSFYVRLLTAPPLPEFTSLRTVLFAGEAFPVESLRELRAALPGRTFANLFGPTETNVSVFHRLRDGEPRDEGLPIGVPCPYAETEVLAEDADVAADTGELAVRGPTVLAAYVGEGVAPVRTVRLPGRGDAPFLRTGDRVTRAADGLLWFRGRLDDLLKVRGFRVEPGEVEATLTAHPDVADAVVRRVVHSSLGEILAADVARRPGATVEGPALRAFAAARLPSYMVPTEVRILPELERTERGKRRRGA